MPPMTDYELLSRLCIERDIVPKKLTDFEMKQKMIKRREIENKIESMVDEKWGDNSFFGGE